MRPRCSALAGLVLLLVAASPATAADPAQGSREERAIEGQWNVTGSVVVEDAVLRVEGSILVEPGAELVLRNVDLVFEGGPGDFRALATRPGADGKPPGVLRLLSTADGPTRVRSASEGMTYNFVSWGTFEARGTPGAPVVIEDVKGRSGGSGARQPVPLFTDGLQLLGPSNVLDHVVFRRSASGIAIASKGETRIDNTSVSDVGFGAYLQQPWNVAISNSTLAGRFSAVYSSRAVNVSIRDSVLTGSEVAVNAVGSALTFSRCTIESRETAFSALDGGTYVLTDNAIGAYAASGMTIGRQGAGSERAPTLSAVGNAFDGRKSASVGILVESGGRVLLERNQVHDHTADGIHVAFAEHVTLRGNAAERNAGQGIDVEYAPFVEDGNTFGGIPEDRNLGGPFEGASLVEFHVVDAFDRPVANASIGVRDLDGGGSVEVGSSEDGVATFVLDVLRIADDGTRTEYRYEATATADGAASAPRIVTPLRDLGVQTLRMETASGDGPLTTPSPGPVAWGLAAAAALSLRRPARRA